jgi:hypothetical protein
MCEDNGVAERQRKILCERWSVQKRRIAWVKDQDILTVTDGNVI